VSLLEDALPEGAVILNRIELAEYIDPDTGEWLTIDCYQSTEGDTMNYLKKIGLLESAKIAACIPMIQSASSDDD